MRPACDDSVFLGGSCMDTGPYDAKPELAFDEHSDPADGPFDEFPTTGPFERSAL